MKNLLLLALILLTTNCYCQIDTSQIQVSYKEYEDSTGKYQIKYEYNSSAAFFALTYPPSEPHFYAMVTVYKKVICRCIDKQYINHQIGEPMQGVYVKGGCFEDSPAGYVNKAKAIELSKTLK